MGPQRMILSLVTVLTIIPYIYGENPAMQFILTNKGLQYGKHMAAGWIQKKLLSIPIPDVSGHFSLSFLGSVYYTLTDITVTKCDFPEPSVDFYEDTTGFKASISGLNIALSGRWMTSYGIIHDGGQFDLAVFNVDVTSILQLGRQADGHLSVSPGSCTAAVGDIHMDFTGGGSWIFKHFVKYFYGWIKGQIEGKICPVVDDNIVNLEYHLQAIPVSYQFYDILGLSVPLTNPPVVNTSSLALGLKGEFYCIQHPEDPPFKAQSFSLEQQAHYMLSLGLSEFTANSASYGLFSAGLLQAVIDDSMIPPSSPVRLNTSFFGSFIPQLPKQYPGLLMELKVYAREMPATSFQPGVVQLGVPGTVKAVVVQPNGTRTPVFSLNVDSTFGSKLWISVDMLKGVMALNNLTLTLVSTEVGPFETEPLEKFVRLAIQMSVVAKVNEILTKGVLLPRIEHMHLVNSVLKMEQGFISMWSDVVVM